MQDFVNQKILLGVCGGIAAYKSAYLVRELTRLGAVVRVVMTQGALEFITPITLQALSGHEVRLELFDPNAERAMGHIELAQWADYLLIAPASANCLAKFAHGLADDLLSTLYLATDAPVILCPAMNRAMWLHQATQDNCDLLVKRGVLMVGPEEGPQACGDVGPGRMSEVDAILNALRLQGLGRPLNGMRVLITAGPTREFIDPVRYLSNRSSGKMGYALAIAAQAAGASVTLVSGPTSLIAPFGVEFHRVDSAIEMLNTVMDCLQPGMIFIGAAAVADYHSEVQIEQKLKKKENPLLTLTLKTNPDILATVAMSKKASFVVGFAAETTDILQHAKEKLHAKGVDMVVANRVGDNVGFEVDYNEATVLTRGAQMDLALTHKIRLAGQIIAILETSMHNVAQ